MEMLTYSHGRMGLLINGRVFVYNFEKLCESYQVKNDLFLMRTRSGLPPIEKFWLGPNYLVTVGGNVFVMFDFWTTDTSKNSESFM